MPDLPEIKGRLTLDDSQVADVMARVGNQAESMGQHVRHSAEPARLAMWGLEESAQRTLESFGIQGQMARKLGDSIGMLVGRLGAGAAAFGAVGIAAMAAYGIYDHFAEKEKKAAEEAKKLAEEKKKVGEEIIRASDAAVTWISSIDKTIPKTRELIRAERELKEVEYERNREVLKRGMFQLETEILDLKSASMDFTVVEYNGQKIVMAQQKEINSGLKSDIELREKKLALYKAQFNAAQGGGLSLEGRDTVSARFEREAAYITAVDQLWFTQDAKYQGHLDMQLAAFDAKTTSQLTNLSIAGATEDSIREQFALREKDRQTKVAQHDKDMQKFRLNTAADMFGTLAGMFQNFSQAGDHDSRRNFRRMKQASIAEATIKGYQSIVDAYQKGTEAGGPWVGAGYALIAGGYVFSQIAKIKSQEYGSDTGASGSYAAAPTTGLPTSPPGSSSPSMNLTLVINGREENIGALTEGMVQELDRRNGSIGGIKIAYTRSA